MNKLGNESSLYLRQHAENPVDWHPWHAAVLDQAREQHRPILLSIGYSACHWCHVMAHESFEDEATAALMNRLFVNIKVDREERPDLDRIYQLAHQLMTGRGGGWPLTVFLEPSELVPFFAGTYFPVERRFGMPAFREVLLTLHKWYEENQDEVREQNGKISEALKSIHSPAGDSGQIPDLDFAQRVLQKSARQIHSRHDSVNGGFGGAPKFPQAPLLNAVACLASIETGDSLDSSLRFTLQRMALGGLRDHLDGGFFRYCVDDKWTIPHFEKMLYDNAMLLPIFAEGAKRWDEPLLKEAACGIAGWLESVMKQGTGGYSASIDADAGGEEGGFHVWTRQQVTELLDESSLQPFLRSYGMDQAPNFEGHAWHLVQQMTMADLAGELNSDTVSVTNRLAKARAVLQEAREKRIHPTLDDKRLTSWNALLAEGYVRAGRALRRDDWLDCAEAIFRFIMSDLWVNNGLKAVFNAGEARFEAYLDDYAWTLSALTLFLQSRWDGKWLEFAIRIADELLARFEDRENGGFFFSDECVDVPITRSMIYQDDATPAGAATAITALNRLGHLLGEPLYLKAAERCMSRAMSQLEESPLAFASLLCALQTSVKPPLHVIISGTDSSQQMIFKHWLDDHDQVDCYLIGPPDESLPGILQAYHTTEPVTAWLCRGVQCLPPVHSLGELEQQLKNGFNLNNNDTLE
ncbi:MAG: DUF255 domain-containing protein [Gammaproteobacteria bacterium]|jgi:uncharacterized protein YyaL (SSP411 family)|nr:DUF255 domain-containing protein [Gammaproteobacteria bacterium]